MQFNFGKLALASAAMAVLSVASLPAMAESATLKVPFNFTVGAKECPAGVYSVQRDSSGNLVTLQSKETSQIFTWIAGIYTDTNPRKVILKFDADGQDHALRSVQYGQVVTGRLDKKSRKTEDISVQGMPGQ